MKIKAPQFELPKAEEVFNLAAETGIDWTAEQERAAKIQRDRQEAARRQLSISFETEPRPAAVAVHHHNHTAPHYAQRRD